MPFWGLCKALHCTMISYVPLCPQPRVGWHYRNTSPLSLLTQSWAFECTRVEHPASTRCYSPMEPGKSPSVGRWDLTKTRPPGDSDGVTKQRDSHNLQVSTVTVSWASHPSLDELVLSASGAQHFTVELLLVLSQPSRYSFPDSSWDPTLPLPSSYPWALVRQEFLPAGQSWAS